MVYFVLVILMRGIMELCGTYGCEIDRYNSDTVLYSDGEILNLTMREGAYPDDIEVTKMTGCCSSPMQLLPDEHFDDTLKKYEHIKQIRIPMTSAMHGCAYGVTMRARGACLVRRVARFAIQRGRAARAQPCQVVVTLRWQEELQAKLAAERQYVCDAEQALCEDRNYSLRRNIVLNAEQIVPNLGSDYSRQILINLSEEDFAKNVSTFVCQAVSECLHGNFTVVGRLVTDDSPPADEDVLYHAGDEYHATCSGPNGHWIAGTDVQRSVENKTLNKKLEIDDDGMKLVCVEINCQAFASNQTCYKRILKAVRFRLKTAQGYGVIACALGAMCAVLAVALAFCIRACRRVPRDVTLRPRMPTPPPERAPHRQPYYSVPFERPLPGPRRD